LNKPEPTQVPKAKETPKETLKETPKETLKETPKETLKEKEPKDEEWPQQIDYCQYCLTNPVRGNHRYCSPCFKTLPKCENFDECGLRTDNEDHGYCSKCYYKFRYRCNGCHRKYIIGDYVLYCDDCNK
jgi:hypothetical protein